MRTIETLKKKNRGGRNDEMFVQHRLITVFVDEFGLDQVLGFHLSLVVYDVPE